MSRTTLKNLFQAGAGLSISLVVIAVPFSRAFILPRLNLSTYTSAKVDSTIAQTKREDTNYIVNVVTPKGIEPFIIENNFLGLGRLNRTTVFAEIKRVENQHGCIDFTAYGYRIPGFSYRGIKEFTPIDCAQS